MFLSPNSEVELELLCSRPRHWEMITSMIGKQPRGRETPKSVTHREDSLLRVGRDCSTKAKSWSSRTRSQGQSGLKSHSYAMLCHAMPPCTALEDSCRRLDQSLRFTLGGLLAMGSWPRQEFCSLRRALEPGSQEWISTWRQFWTCLARQLRPRDN